jgi:DNA-directed RNA polymerase II subunit RPB1
MQMIMHLEGTATDNVLKILPPPAIIRPKPLWTGKQIMSLIIPDVNMIRGQTSKDGRTDYVPIREKMVLIQRGEFLIGEFTKAIVGASSGGLVHIIWKESGPIACSDFLSSL